MYVVKYTLRGEVYKIICLCVTSLLDTLFSIIYEYYENDDMAIDVYDQDSELIWSI